MIEREAPARPAFARAPARRRGGLDHRPRRATPDSGSGPSSRPRSARSPWSSTRGSSRGRPPVRRRSSPDARSSSGARCRSSLSARGPHPGALLRLVRSGLRGADPGRDRLAADDPGRSGGRPQPRLRPPGAPARGVPDALPHRDRLPGPGPGFSATILRVFFSRVAPDLRKGVGPWLLLATIFTCKLNDIGGYLVGSFVGRTRLAPGDQPEEERRGLGRRARARRSRRVVRVFLVLPDGGSRLADSTPCSSASLALGRHSGERSLRVVDQAGRRGQGLRRRFCRHSAESWILVDSFILAAPAGYTLLWLWTA